MSTHTAAPRDTTYAQFRPASPKALAFATSLLETRRVPAEWETAAVEAIAEGNARRVSGLIDALKALPWREARATVDLPEVPAGRYAVTTEAGPLAFYRVSRPTEGRWAGRTFVAVQASDDEHPVRGQAAAAVLAKIATDPEAASRAYGREIGACGVCGRTLTDEASRAAGIGPVCAAKF